MKQEVQIAFHGMDHSDAIEDEVRRRVDKLEQYCRDIVSCRVTIEGPHHQHHKGNIYGVAVELVVPRDKLVVGREPTPNHAHEDVYVAIRDAFDAAHRQLEAYAERRRGRVKRHQQRPFGTVRQIFDYEGYGFIRLAEGGPDVYFHQNSVTDNRFSDLEEGDPVEVVIAEGEGDDGPQASAVIPVR